MARNSFLAINFEYALIEYYKKLSLDENEVVTILMIKHLLEQKNTLITAELLAIKMNLNTIDLDQILVSLMNKKIITYESSKSGLITSLEPLENKLSELYQIEMNKNSLNKNDDEKNKDIEIIYEAFETSFGRSLSPVELSLIDEWINNDYSKEQILDALKEGLSKGKYSLKSIDRILLKWKAREDIEKEGITPIKNKWEKGLDETIDDANELFDKKK